MWIVGIGIAFVVLIAAGLPLIFNRPGLAGSKNALGLPDGSIRALIALLLMALFATVPLYLFNEIGGKTLTMTGLDPAEKPAIQAKYKESDLLFLKEAGTTDKMTVVVRQPTDVATIDFAKQMVVLLGTLATAVTSFFFGANTANAASAQGAAQSVPQPKVKPSLGTAKSDPPTLTRDPNNNSIEFKLNLTGTGLNDVTAVRITSGADTFTFHSRSNQNEVQCGVSCSPKSPAVADWDVCVIDSFGQVSEPLHKALRF